MGCSNAMRCSVSAVPYVTSRTSVVACTAWSACLDIGWLLHGGLLLLQQCSTTCTTAGRQCERGGRGVPCRLIVNHCYGHGPLLPCLSAPASLVLRDPVVFAWMLRQHSSFALPPTPPFLASRSKPPPALAFCPLLPAPASAHLLLPVVPQKQNIKSANRGCDR